MMKWPLLLLPVLAVAAACGKGMVHLSVSNDGTTSAAVSVYDSSSTQVVNFGSLTPGKVTEAQQLQPGTYTLALTTAASGGSVTVDLSYDLSSGGNFVFKAGSLDFLRTDADPSPSPVPAISQ